MTTGVMYHKDSSMIRFAASKLIDTIARIEGTVKPLDITANVISTSVIIISDKEEAASKHGITIDNSVAPEGFEIRKREGHSSLTWYILAGDEAGAMYGTLELEERLRSYGSLLAIPACVMNARFPFRAIKFNLPWSSYRKNECFELQKDTVRDLAFWQKFLDMMAQNRYNVLTLWNLHPFPYMIRPVHFPEACPFNEEELTEWKQYWTALFRMAKERGIETYMVNWNIFVSEAYREHYDPQAISDETFYHYGDSYSTDMIKQYTRECVTQLIDEYPDLTGLGISLGERMNDMSPQSRQDWVNDVYFEGMKQASRPVKFIHRAPFSVDPSITRNAIESNGFMPEPVWVEVKFNWSHAYSSSKLLLTHGGSQGMEGYWKPSPTNYKITWMVRNEDFFTLRWAQPDFIREHIVENGQDYVGGYYIGSECMIPGIDYSHLKDSDHKDWTYLFEKNWLYYMLWGRLLYEPDTPDRVFEKAIEQRHRAPIGVPLLKAYAAVCKMPMALASMYSFTWDFTLYAEGFMSTDEAEYDGGASFISLQDLLERKTFNPHYLSVSEYVDQRLEGQTTDKVSPLGLAETLEEDANRGLEWLAAIKADTPVLCCEKADIEAWAHLTYYFADKLRAAVSYELYRRTGDEAERLNAIQLLEAPHAAGHWERLIAVTKSHYVEHPLMHLGKTPFSWELYRPQVLADIAFVYGNDQTSARE
ncbi:hypothetical protein GQF01_25280 [Paenibacillus sp. 5J-6]|uniref:Beta-hexosaminidase bacterial type N-terminal domain-containing protein n=2 Tax=Paenibacillus silvestris TaxID=2606219 RepID=A0A6L8V751_9BACL|nr:hypothetical protein [Paenibacillus silvestris]